MFDFSAMLNKMGRLIVRETVNGIKRGNWNEKSFHRNAESTIKQKGHKHPLQGKSRNGEWLDASLYKIEKATKSNQEVKVTIPKSDIALYNQAPTGNGSIKNAREFWGISKKIEDTIEAEMEAKINSDFEKEMIKHGFKAL